MWGFGGRELLASLCAGAILLAVWPDLTSGRNAHSLEDSKALVASTGSQGPATYKQNTQMPDKMHVVLQSEIEQDMFAPKHLLAALPVSHSTDFKSQALSRGTKAQFKQFRIVNCRPHTMSTGAPTLVVDVLKNGSSHSVWLKNTSLEVGQSIHLSLHKSKPHVDHPGVLKKKWLFLPPKHPETKLKARSANNDIRVTLDSPGVYRFLAVLKDQRGLCAFRLVSIRASVNPKLKSLSQYPSVEALRSRYKWSRFDHLVDFETPQAWKLSQGRGQVIAIVDTGVDYNHPFLRHNVFINEAEIADNNIDDDNNGYVDDRYGWDFYNKDPYAFDDGSHGTMVTGFAASSVFGQARGARFLPLKVVDGSGNGRERDVGKAIEYAVDMGATVVSVSLAFTSFKYVYHPVYKAIQYAYKHGVLVVIGAGNGDPISKRGRDLNVSPRYPVCFDLPNVVGVASVQRDVSFLSSWSDYGLRCVDLAMHGGERTGGEGLLSSTISRAGKPFAVARMSGTSVSTALVSGVIALIQARAPHLSADEVLQVLLRSGQYSSWLTKYVVSSRVLDSLSPLQELRF